MTNNEIAKAYENGSTLTMLARITKQGVQDVRKIIVSEGVAIRGKGGRAIVSERTKQMIDMHQKNHTLQEIGDAFGGISRERVRQILTAEGIKMRKSGPRKAALSPREMEIIDSYNNDPHSVLQKYNIEYRDMRHIASKAGLKLAKKNFTRPRENIDKIIKDYADGQMTVQQIVDKYNFTQGAELYSVLDDNGVERRNKEFRG